MAGTPQLSVTLTATDKISEVLDVISRRLDITSQLLERMPRLNARVNDGLGELSRQMKTLHEDAPTIFSRFGEAASVAGGAVEKLHGHVHGLWAKLTELVPVLAGLGTIGAVGGLFESVEATGENREQFEETARALNMSTAALAKWNFMAKMAGQDADKVDDSFGKLAENLSKAAHGEDKGLAAKLKAAHIQFTDNAGQARSPDDVLPQLQMLFQRNAGNTSLPEVGKSLFGKSWKAVAKVFEMPAEDIKQFNEDFSRIKFAPNKEEIEESLKYHHAWVEIGATIKSIGTSISYTLAPALEPLLTGVKEFLISHKDGIRGWVGKEALAIGKGLEQNDWPATFKMIDRVLDILGFAISVVPLALGRIADFLDDFRKSWLGRMIGLAPAAAPGAEAKSVPSLPGMPREDRSSKEPADVHVTPLRKMFDTMEHALAPRIGPRLGYESPKSGPSTGLWFNGRPTDGSPVPNWFTLPPGSAPVPESTPLHRWWEHLKSQGGWNNGPGPSGQLPNVPSWYDPIHSSGARGGAGTASGSVDITLTLPNLPRGAMVDARSTGIAGPVRVNTGQAFGGLYGDH